MVCVPLYLLVSLTALADGVPRHNTCLLVGTCLTTADAHSLSLYNIPLHVIAFLAILLYKDSDMQAQNIIVPRTEKEKRYKSTRVQYYILVIRVAQCSQSCDPKN